MRSSIDYADLAETALREANNLLAANREGAERLRAEAQVWAALAIAASNLERPDR